MRGRCTKIAQSKNSDRKNIKGGREREKHTSNLPKFRKATRMPPKRKPKTNPEGDDASSGSPPPKRFMLAPGVNLPVSFDNNITVNIQLLPTVVVASLGEGVDVFPIPARDITQEVSEALELAAGGHRDNCEGPKGDALEKVWEWCSDPGRPIVMGSEELNLKEKHRREEMGYGKFWHHRVDEKAGPSAALVIIKQDA